MSKPALTERQQEIFNYITDHWAKHGYGPTSGDIRRNFGFKSPNSSTEHVMALTRKGYVEVTPTSIYPAGLKATIKEVVSKFRTVKNTSVSA